MEIIEYLKFIFSDVVSLRLILFFIIFLSILFCAFNSFSIHEANELIDEINESNKELKKFNKFIIRKYGIDELEIIKKYQKHLKIEKKKNKDAIEIDKIKRNLFY